MSKDVEPNFKRPKEPKKPRQGLVRKTALRFRSKKMAKVYREKRVPMTAEALAENPYCEVCSVIKTVAPDWNSCWRYADGLHEVKKRSAGGALVGDSNQYMRACSPANAWIEDFPVLARKAGLSVHSWEKP